MVVGFEVVEGNEYLVFIFLGRFFRSYEILIKKVCMVKFFRVVLV